ncbi:hypothetical protein G6661_01680 [Polynucleobacter paneuropaeus]|nr:hypothetical protein G6661_01680 [Polynucleobacter paneuropaeus]
MTVHLLSFVAGMPNSKALAERFSFQAKSCSFIDQIHIVSDPDQELYQNFHLEFLEFVKSNPRGYGYWLWKPFIVLNYLKKIPDNDVLLYCDIGCELSPLGDKVFGRYLDSLDHENFLAFSTFTKNSERSWSKAELINLLAPDPTALDSEQVAATFFLVKKTPQMIQFLKEWLSICTLENFSYLTDELQVDQATDFIEHRHDQSIFSLLVKKYNLPILRERTFFPPEVYYPKSFALNFPVHTLRSKGQHCFIHKSLYENGRGIYLYEFIKYQIIFTWSRLLRKIKLIFRDWRKSL